MNEAAASPKLSVCVITYNQEAYIGQCLQSIVNQETNFAFEVIVGDDCSTDGTRTIVQKFANRYPGIVKPIFQEKNIGGGSNNFLTVHQAAIGEYIAHVDGDDYCLPGKLQAQVNMLDSDPACTIVFHRMLLLMPTGRITEDRLANVENLDQMRFDRGAILQYMAIGGHSSKMYRRRFRDYTVPNFDISDYFANVEQVGDGYARFVGYECFGVYRVAGGIATDGSRSRRALANSFKYFSVKYPEYIVQINTAALMYFLADLKNYRETWRMFFLVWLKTFRISSISNLVRSMKLINNLKIR